MAGDRIRAPWWLKPFLKRSGLVTNGTPDELQGLEGRFPVFRIDPIT